jgi:hypothetical protein
MMSWQTINKNGYDKHIEEVYLFINKSFSLAKSLIVLSQCRRVREVYINVTNNGNTSKGMRVEKRILEDD